MRERGGKRRTIYTSIRANFRAARRALDFRLYRPALDHQPLPLQPRHQSRLQVDALLSSRHRPLDVRARVPIARWESSLFPSQFSILFCLDTGYSRSDIYFLWIIHPFLFILWNFCFWNFYFFRIFFHSSTCSLFDCIRGVYVLELFAPNPWRN